VRVIVLEAVPEDEEILVAWNDLVFRMERPEVFFTHQWALAASRTFAASLSPKIFLMYESGQLAGIAAMATTRESPTAAFFLTASTADYCDIVSAPETRDAIVKALLERMKDLGVRDLVLANVPAESSTLRAFAASARSQGFHVHDRPGYDCGIISFGDAAQRQDVLQSVLRKVKEKRCLKKLSELGNVEVVHLTPADLETGLLPIFAAHVSRFLATTRLSPLVDPQRRFFLTELAKSLSSAGWLKVSALLLNKRPVAWNYGFKFHGSWFWYLPTFEMPYEEFSPGSTLLRLLIEQACGDSSVSRLDLGLGDEAYKERFRNDIHSICYVQLTKSLPGHVVNVGRHWLASSVERIPEVEKRLREGRSRLRGLRNRIEKMGVGATLGHALMRVKTSAISREEVAMFEAPRLTMPENENVALRPLDWDTLARAAMQNANDELTLEYLCRCAQRLRTGKVNGYYLAGPEKEAAHFLWVDLYHGFHLSEIDSRLESSDPTAAMIFDCWTPLSERGRGVYACAIRLAALDLQAEQRQAWIFSAAANESSLRGILKAGFVYRFSLVRIRKFGITTMSRHSAGPPHRSVSTKEIKLI